MSALISDQQSSPNVAEFFSPGPGERLRAARLSMGLDLAKIASELHLTGAVIERLEADDYAAVGARVFVRGYLRNYARIVEMPVESILRQFDEKWPDDTPNQTMLRESPRLPADGSPSRGWAGAMNWLLVIGAVVLFLMWWRGYLDEIVPEQIRSTGSSEIAVDNGAASPDQPMIDSNAAVGPSTPDGGLRLPSLIGDTPQLAAETDLPKAVAELTASTAAGPGQSVEVLPAAPVLGAAEQPAAAPPEVVPVSETVASSPEVAAAADETASVEASTGPVQAGAPVVDAATGIVMTFSAPCWVDVRDSSRKFKLFGEMPKGARKVLGGEPPYKVVIGNARAVDIVVNGEKFDLARYAKGNVARFTLVP